MKKYLLHILIISFVFILVPIAQVASYDTEKGIEDAKEEVRENPDDAQAHCNLGNAYETLDKHQEPYKYQLAIKSYKQAIRINPDYAEAHVNLGVA